MSVIAKIPLKEFIYQARLVIILTLIYVPLNTLFDAIARPNDEILFFLIPPYFPVRRLTCYWAIRTGIIILILFSSSIIFTRITNLKDLVYSFIQLGIPYRYAFAFMIGLRYIPIIQNEASLIEMAQKLRGFGIRKGISVKMIFKHLVHRLSILLIAIFRKTHTTAMAVEIRGFGVHDHRTNLHIVPWKKSDTILIGSILILFILGILYGMGFFAMLQFPSLYSFWNVYFKPLVNI
jgi:energy-coupling factor transporter transmembrane protein EcfT